MWFEGAVFYEVDAGAFGGDGERGDLRGVIRRLEHIRAVGATAVWLQPFYVSPYRDSGYDVVDHLGVSDRFGTLADVRDLIARADELDLRIVLDLVVQHTSVDHPWFRAARSDPGSPYRDYYVWADEPHPTIAEPVFPTLEDSVWQYDERAGLYYRHTFLRHEADLDTGNPAVRAEIRRIATHWLELGVSGFRVDAVPYMVRQAALTDSRDDGFWFLEELYKAASSVRSDVVLMGEVDVPADQLPRYFGDGDRLTMVLDFWLNNYLFLALARCSAEPLVRALRNQPSPPPGAQYATWLRNHDELDLERLSAPERAEVMARFAPRPDMRAYGRGIRRRLAPMLRDPRRIAMAHALLFALPGAPVLRYGDEVGLGEDLSAPDRAALRLPMPWTDGSDSVAAQALRPGSLLSLVAQLAGARADLGPLREERCEVLPVTDDAVLAVAHHTPGGALLMLTNLADRSADVRLPATYDDADLTDLVANSNEYDAPAAGRVRLNPYGYRWLRA
ncbi:MAG TPA: alpha-amylase family glycosyl hydrolase [Kribbellaceae bacterium]